MIRVYMQNQKATSIIDAPDIHGPADSNDNPPSIPVLYLSAVGVNFRPPTENHADTQSIAISLLPEKQLIKNFLAQSTFTLYNVFPMCV